MTASKYHGGIMTQYLDRAGLRFAYDDAGARGARPVAVLIHGWLSERADLRAVGAALAPTYRVIALDAAGHGESAVPGPDTAAERLAIPAQAADVVALCDHLGVRDALLVGHSAGGAVAVELAARRPDLAAAVVALDATMLFRKEVLAGVEPLLGALRTPAWREALGGFLHQSYLPTDDPALLAAELAAVARMPQHVVAAVPEQFLEWDAEAALREMCAPLLYVDASQMTDLDRLAELVPTVAIARTAAVGHVQLIAHPRQAIAAIEDFAAAHGRPPVDNREPVLGLFEAVQAGELDRIDDLVSPDFVDHGAPPGMVPPGPEGYRAVFGLLKSALQIDYAMLDVVAEGESVMAWVRCTGRHVGEFAGIPPTGREFAFEAMHRYRVEDGVIREHHAVRDDLALFRQLGLVP
jgi:pimeloyl-ACP methyl ester carboxylesterase/predicted ester cyclase